MSELKKSLKELDAVSARVRRILIDYMKSVSTTEAGKTLKKDRSLISRYASGDREMSLGTIRELAGRLSRLDSSGE